MTALLTLTTNYPLRLFAGLTDTTDIRHCCSALLTGAGGGDTARALCHITRRIKSNIDITATFTLIDTEAGGPEMRVMTRHRVIAKDDCRLSEYEQQQQPV